VEFTGGTVMEVAIRSRPTSSGAPHRRRPGLGDVQVQNFGTARDVLIRLPAQKGVSSAQQSERVMAR
jgi:preprotein translocase subunit SecF